ncbi:hypothetical protein Glove_303g103 [Diversispora epigaea]|uniref:Endoplasmic reticulum vesicle transporter C-terminal domain-containing protein n=1 Tax=Diversispora epigaea TaxID=1348612 RepID=A0A397HZN9_9GLOM|nr:hypothetical protein Glove_303g103 [Diversispora epigaea]
MISRILKKAIIFDAFPKVDSGYQNKSPRGGFITIIVTIFLWILIISEFREYWNMNQKYEFLVDRSINHKMQINVDITVNTQCAYLTVDLIDAAGEAMHLTNELNIAPATFKVGTAHAIGYDRNKGGDDYDDDTRIDVRQVIKNAAGKFNIFNQNEKSNDNKMEACRIFGNLEVNKVTGNLHITAIGYGYGGFFFKINEESNLNFTHRIDEFSFGTFYPRLVNPLDNSIEVAERNIEAFQYFLSVVPTTYIDNSNGELLTNQYSVTDYSKIYDASKRQYGIPGIFFKYDIEPISIRITEKSQGFIKFTTRLCGLVGGIWVTVGFIMKFLNRIGLFFDKILGRLKNKNDNNNDNEEGKMMVGNSYNINSTNNLNNNSNINMDINGNINNVQSNFEVAGIVPINSTGHKKVAID